MDWKFISVHLENRLYWPIRTRLKNSLTTQDKVLIKDTVYFSSHWLEERNPSKGFQISFKIKVQMNV